MMKFTPELGFDYGWVKSVSPKYPRSFRHDGEHMNVLYSADKYDSLGFWMGPWEQLYCLSDPSYRLVQEHEIAFAEEFLHSEVIRGAKVHYFAAKEVATDYREILHDRLYSHHKQLLIELLKDQPMKEPEKAYLASVLDGFWMLTPSGYDYSNPHKDWLSEEPFIDAVGYLIEGVVTFESSQKIVEQYGWVRTNLPAEKDGD